jgi:ribosomal protein S18 acetylase RimI-like enzyme
MAPDEAGSVAAMIQSVITGLDFYNERARATEIGIYTAEYLLAALADDPDAVLVAEQGSALAGFCVSRYDDDLIWLSWFGAAPGSVRLGIGSALLLELHTRRHAAGVHKIWCDSRTDNHASRSCLARAGYTEICMIRDHWYRQDYVLLERRLK